MTYMEEFEKLAHEQELEHHHAVIKTRRSIEQLENTAINAITTALGFVIALTWVDTIRLTFQEALLQAGITGSGLQYNIMVTCIITFFCVLGIVYLPKLALKKDIEEATDIIGKMKKSKARRKQKTKHS